LYAGKVGADAVVLEFDADSIGCISRFLVPVGEVGLDGFERQHGSFLMDLLGPF